MTTSKAIIRFGTYGKTPTSINYTRRMYAIIRRYTPDVTEGGVNECFADLTGLRTFFKMTYSEIAQKIQKELAKELGLVFTLKIASTKTYISAKNKTRKSQSISTYKEINSLFAGSTFTPAYARKTTTTIRKKRLAVPFIGKVS